MNELVTTMTAVELQSRLQEKFNSTGVGPFINQDFSQVLDFPEGFFAEVVLNDASKLHDAERSLAELSESLEQTGVQLDSVVRALWTVREVQSVGPARTVAGTPKAALAFKAVLQSGARQHEVYVQVTFDALDRLREELGIKNRGEVDEDTLSNVVREFLTLQLSNGGTSYWDPIRFPNQALTPAAMSYLLTIERGLSST